MTRHSCVLSAALATTLFFPAGERPAASQDPTQQRDLPAFLGPLRPVKAPEDNPTTTAKVELGRMLFWDPRLSGNGAIACASCHNPALGWADGLPKGAGFNHQVLGRSAPTVLNAAYYASQFWDGRAPTLEEQAKGPIQSPKEMNANPERVVAAVNALPGYRKRFQEVFGGAATFDSIAKAIAAFERTVVDLDSPFDRFARGDDSAISEEARRGLDVFTGKGRCATCHSGPNLSDSRFHNIGLGDGDPGRIKVSGKDEDHGAFRTPTLRNIALTAPYMHDGSMRTLRETIDHYERVPGDKPRPKALSIFMQPIKLTQVEKSDVEAFLRTLTGDKRPEGIDVVPELPQ